jgi:hypothetical protein
LRFEIAGIPGLMDAQPDAVPTGTTSVLPKPVVISTSKESANASLPKATGDSRPWALLLAVRRIALVYLPMSALPETKVCQRVASAPARTRSERYE